MFYTMYLLFCFFVFILFFLGSLNHLQTACESLLALAHPRRNHLQVSVLLLDPRVLITSATSAAERSLTLAAGRVALSVPQREFRQSRELWGHAG